jgi:RND family efflux transporter MFP subunit
MKLWYRSLTARRKKYLLIGMALLFIVILIWLFSGSSSKSIPAYTVKQGEFIISVTESGEMKSATNISITAPRISGKLQIVRLAPEGTTVKVGDLLVQFDLTDVEKKISDKKNELSIAESDYRKLIADQLANMARIEADVDNNRISYEQAKLSAERMKFESESMQKGSQLDLERSKNTYDGAKQRIVSQKIIDKSDQNRSLTKIQQIKSDIEAAKKDIEALTIKASFPGLVVYEFNWSNGKKFALGDSPWGGQTIISLPDLSNIQVITSVNEVDVSKVKAGQVVKIKLDAFPDRNFTGKVASVGTIGKNKEQGSNVKVFEVIINVDGTDPVFKPGMSTSNEIITEVLQNVVYIPLESVFEKDDKTVVYKMGSSFKPQEVKLGKKNSDYVIIEQGLNPGDKVSLKDPTVESEDGAETSSSKQKEIKQMPKKPEGGVRIIGR